MDYVGEEKADHSPGKKNWPALNANDPTVARQSKVARPSGVGQEEKRFTMIAVVAPHTTPAAEPTS